ncbi:GAF domain-containing protein [Arcticibacter tournemirensis]|uniref:GAF domain-containing protein n=1 Tax=Arcticibacter tournemirensis TaxID=699437 RepID=A0A4Q0M5V7_9SPHI|nr:GAF domain-containing protein [Arcticibacter tournemirensis]RXF68397.1 GAF domain-containing protein [Arcticibacter tournemirensis]
MKSAVLRFNKEAGPQIVDSALSFKPFIQTLSDRANTEASEKKKFYELILDKFKEHGLASDRVEPEEVVNKKDILELIFATLTPLITAEKDYLWALGTPVPEAIFYCTDAFAQFFENNILANHSNDLEHFERSKYEFIYSLVLKKYYNIDAFIKDEKLYAYTDPHTGLSKYLSIQADTRFIDVSLKGPLPDLNIADIEHHIYDKEAYQTLIELLPLELFRVDGFSVLTFSDVTLKHAIENIRNLIISNDYTPAVLYESVIQSLKTLAGDNKVEFGLLPFLMLNGKPVFEDNDSFRSILVNCALQKDSVDEIFEVLVNSYQKNPKPVFFGTLTEEKTELHPVLDLLRQNGIVSYAVLPIFYNNQLPGVLEIYSREGTISYEHILARLELAIPLLAQLLQNVADEFKSKIERVIKRKFTSLQPSVQWKFNEAAWNYLKAKRKDGAASAEIETISFKDVYPLYGAIDIRDSTTARNLAVKEDSAVLLRLCANTLLEIKKHHQLTLIDELIYECNKWAEKISAQMGTNDEILLSQFFEQKADPFLLHFKSTSPELTGVLQEYFRATKHDDGIAFSRRRELEASIQTINDSVNSYMEQVQPELQQSYPCYFEKFRTDGVEYDIYIGQSIAPDKAFNNLYIKNLRLWQLKSMIEIAGITHSLLSKTAIPLQTTQLIFIHSNPIDISFRNDERRFDVEGTYNIRYEILKKRIDKVRLKGSEERLTQPDKIALVYFNYKEAEEYVQYISYLQEQTLLKIDLEHLELEELQGVTGLKALRVGVNYND